MCHRGNDAKGIVLLNHDNRNDSKSLKNVGFGHCRLSIIDISEDGKQPMETADGNYIITYNGELYNYLELRQQLQQAGYVFKSNTDTEVVLYAYRQWGGNCLKYFK